MLIGWDRGHFSLIKRALLVIKRAWLLDADWLSTLALNWFPSLNWVWKRNFRNASLLSLILTRSFHLNVKENQYATKRSLLVKSKRIFPTKTVLIRRVKTVRVGTAGVERSTRQNFVASKLKVNFFVLLRVDLLVLQALKNSVNSVGTLRVRSGKESLDSRSY